jgi:hypothetical protein
LLKEQETMSKYQGHTITENQESIFINNAVVKAIPDVSKNISAVSRVDRSVARQQQLDDGNATFTGSDM